MFRHCCFFHFRSVATTTTVESPNKKRRLGDINHVSTLLDFPDEFYINVTSYLTPPDA
jgi:hypothetical protein